MAYAIRQSSKNKYRKSIELTSESYHKWHDFRKMVLENVYDNKLIDPPILTMGLRYPEPDFIPEIDCEFTAEEFGHFMPSIPGIAITQSVIDIIEDIEPGVHQYFPIKFILRSGERQPQPYFLLNTCTYIQTFDLENPKFDVSELNEERHEHYPHHKYTVIESELFKSGNLDKPPILTLFKDKIRGRALWGEYGYDRTIYSQEMVERVNAMGGFTPYEVCLEFKEI